MSIGYWPSDEAFPKVLSDRQLMRVLGISRALFYQLKARGTYDCLKCREGFTGRFTRYSGDLVQRWAEGHGKAFLRRAS